MASVQWLCAWPPATPSHLAASRLRILANNPRSEERRVGKSCLAPRRACAWATPGRSTCEHTSESTAQTRNTYDRSAAGTPSLSLQVGRRRVLTHGARAVALRLASRDTFPLGRKSPSHSCQQSKIGRASCREVLPRTSPGMRLGHTRSLNLRTHQRKHRTNAQHV